MVHLLMALTVLASQPGGCSAAASTMLAEAEARAAEFDMTGAEERLERADDGCETVTVVLSYVRGLRAARQAYRDGGSPESLALVAREIAALEPLARFPGPAALARFGLMAAVAAAQSERDEMAVLLEHAVQMEAIQLAAREPGAPLITAHELAADLWFQVHRYDEARAAYHRASERVGRTPRVIAGLARSAARLSDAAVACAEYGALLEWWGTRSRPAPDEVEEARRYLQQPACAAARR